MSKTENLLNRMGNGLADSIGIRPGQSTTPVYANSPSSVPRTDFIRNRSVGEISPAEVIPDPDQPRKTFDEQEIQRLADDIQKRGQLQPIRVRWSATHGKWIIVAGERRWRAVQKAGLTKITCIFIDKEMSENEIRSEQLVENLLREDLNGLELAKSFSSLMELNGWTATQLAQTLNISKAKVSKALSLFKLPADLQAKIEDGSLPPSTAYELAKVKGEEKQRELAEKALSGQATQPEVAKATRTRGADKPARRSTNETFRTADSVRITIASRRALDDAQLIQALIEVAENIRKRTRQPGNKAA